MLGTLEILPSQDVRKVGMTSNQHGPYVRGYTRVTMGDTEGRHRVTGRQSIKIPLSSDWSLQPDSTKLDSLVIAHQPWRGEYVPGPSHGAVNTFPGLVHTARQAMKAWGA